METKFDHLNKYLDGYGTLNEKKIWGLLHKENPTVHKKVDLIAKEIDYDVNLAMSFALSLLESVNVSYKSVKEINDLFIKISKKVE